MARQLTHRQALALMGRIEREGAAIGLAHPGVIPERGPHPRKPRAEVVGDHYTVVATDTTSGERVEIPATITNFPALAAWRGQRSE